ncbi:MAG: SHOCT domain-containing protein [Deltaproteobacteria bacterium]|nr:SHOCT domain-containing protein [Deltaproteobacteria bacterium]
MDDGKMNLVLGNFRLELEHDIEPYDGDPRARYLMATFRIDPAPHLMPPPVVEFDNLLKKEHRNWIVADYKSWAMDDKAPDAPPDVTPAEKSAEERLEELRRLRDKGLITEEEYEQKRREIVDAL